MTRPRSSYALREVYQSLVYTAIIWEQKREDYTLMGHHDDIYNDRNPKAESYGRTITRYERI